VLAPSEHEDTATLPATAAAFAAAAQHAHLRRIVFVSDIAVHGAVPAEGTNDDSPLPRHAPGSRPAAYAAAEEAFLAAAGRDHPKSCVLRAGRLYGARAEGFARLVAELAAGATDGDADDAAYNGLHVDNLVAAVRSALAARNGGRRPFLVTDTGSLSARGFRRAVARELHAPDGSQGALVNKRHDESRWNLSAARAMRVLGYQPALPPGETILRACAWWRFVADRP
jgi:nucleoside-diphosphate-sugar epimerase